MSIGRNIAHYRAAAGLSQKELAARINKHPSAVSHYESGRITPRMYVIERIADVLGILRASTTHT